MLRFFVLATAVLVFIACGNQENQNADNNEHTHDGHDHDHHGHDHGHDHDKGDGVHFGLTEISAEGAIPAGDLVAKLEQKKDLTELTVGENKFQGLSAAKVEGTITEICQAAGCWFRMKTEDGKELFIQMKEHKSVPKDWSGKTVVAQGDAFIKEISVDEQKHYLEDSNAPQEEIAAVKEPKMEYNLIAEGVVLKK